LGSDVPFFLYGGTAVASGRGENVISMPPIHKLNLVLLRPPIKSISGKTAQLYSQIKPVHFTQGKYTEKLTDHIRSGAHIENHIAGSGPTLFTLLPGEDEGKDLISNLEADGLEAYLVQTVDESPLMSVGDLQ
jgi:4-diphosphocytidyl-2-C-methyl-D-erythritol kinase